MTKNELAEGRLSMRTDPELEEALAVLTQTGATTRTMAARNAILDAARAARRAQLRAEAERIANDPRERALAAEILAQMDRA